MTRTRLIELAVVIALGYFQHYLLQAHLDFLFLDEAGQYRWLALALSMAPLFALYFLMRVVLPCTVAGALTAGTSLLLTEVSNTKQALTTEPLSWTDITRTDNLSVVPHYINQSHIIYALLVVAGIGLLMRLDQTARLKKTGIVLAALFSLLSLHPYLNRIDTPLSHVAQFELTRQDINYVVWDWPRNIRKNGLLTHLVQTGQRRMPPKPSTTEREQFDILTASSTDTSVQPSNIIVILCEACWHDEQHFKEAFSPLEKIGFQAFRAIAPQIERVVAFGNCDAASALMLAQGDLCDALVLSNPWTIEDDAGKLPPAAVRARYLEKLTNPRELIRLATGKISPAKLASGLRQALSRAPAPSSLAEEMARGLDASGKPYVILLAANDRTAQVFETQWPYDLAAETQGEVRRCEGASHAYVEPYARDWLEQQILAMLRG